MTHFCPINVSIKGARNTEAISPLSIELSSDLGPALSLGKMKADGKGSRYVNNNIAKINQNTFSFLKKQSIFKKISFVLSRKLNESDSE